jgi:NADH-quinone oxidoreductase subunit J
MNWLVANVVPIVFYTAATLAVAGAVGVIWFKNPVHAALSLLATFLAVAGLFVLRHAEFIAAVQIVVYAGGVMVLFLFVMMLVNVQTLPREYQYVHRLVPAAVVTGGILAAVLAAGILTSGHAAAAPSAALVSVEGQVMGNTEAVGWMLYRDFLLPFEVVSIVLLVAMIGAIVMGRKDRPDEEKEGGA